MSTTPTFSPRLLGETEKTLNAILARQLEGTGLTEPDWVTLVLTATSGPGLARDELVGRVAAGLKVEEAQARERVDGLVGARMLQVSGDRSTVMLTETGSELFGRIRGAVDLITERLWGDLPAQDLGTAGRVLGTILARAEAELAPA
jgi:hypothetical protein